MRVTFSHHGLIWRVIYVLADAYECAAAGKRGFSIPARVD